LRAVEAKNFNSLTGDDSVNNALDVPYGL